MKIDGYKVLCEFFTKKVDEKILKSYPFVSVDVYHGDELETSRKLVARLTVTDKRFIVDRLSSAILFPIIKPSKTMRSFSLLDIAYFFKKVKEVQIPFEYIKNVSYDKDEDALMIDTLLDNYLIFVKTRNSKKFAEEVINLLQSKILKSYKHLRIKK